MELVLYTAKTHTTGGRNGVSRSADGRLEIGLSPPGATGSGTNPEELFSAAWAACFEGALASAARRMKVVLPLDSSIDAEIDLCDSEDAHLIQARLKVFLLGMDARLAVAVVAAAHDTCAYSKATRNNIKVDVSVVV